MVGVGCLLVLVGLGCFEVLFVCCDGFGFNVVWVLWFVWCGVAVVCGALVLNCLSGCGRGSVVYCIVLVISVCWWFTDCLGVAAFWRGRGRYFGQLWGFVIVGILWSGLGGFWLVCCWDGCVYC